MRFSLPAPEFRVGLLLVSSDFFFGDVLDFWVSDSSVADLGLRLRFFRAEISGVHNLSVDTFVMTLSSFGYDVPVDALTTQSPATGEASPVRPALAFTPSRLPQQCFLCGRSPVQ